MFASFFPAFRARKNCATDGLAPRIWQVIQRVAIVLAGTFVSVFVSSHGQCKCTYVCIRLCERVEFLTTWAQHFPLLGFPLSFVLSLVFFYCVFFFCEKSWL